jgi:hypothetical protein
LLWSAPTYSASLENNPNPSLGLENENFILKLEYYYYLSLKEAATEENSFKAASLSSFSFANKNKAVFYSWKITLMAFSLKGSKDGIEFMEKNVYNNPLSKLSVKSFRFSSKDLNNATLTFSGTFKCVLASALKV